MQQAGHHVLCVLAIVSLMLHNLVFICGWVLLFNSPFSCPTCLPLSVCKCGMCHVHSPLTWAGVDPWVYSYRSLMPSQQSVKYTNTPTGLHSPPIYTHLHLFPFFKELFCSASLCSTHPYTLAVNAIFPSAKACLFLVTCLSLFFFPWLF